jgi:hypothetical protein
MVNTGPDAALRDMFAKEGLVRRSYYGLSIIGWLGGIVKWAGTHLWCPLQNMLYRCLCRGERTGRHTDQHRVRYRDDVNESPTV